MINGEGVHLSFLQTIAVILGVLVTLGIGIAGIYEKTNDTFSNTAEQYGQLKQEVEDQKDQLMNINNQLGKIQEKINTVQVDVATLAAQKK